MAAPASWWAGACSTPAVWRAVWRSDGAIPFGTFLRFVVVAAYIAHRLSFYGHLSPRGVSVYVIFLVGE